jgi:hypothetical protein
MTRYRVEQAAATGLGFFVGSTLAVFIAPGDVLLSVLAGAVLAIFSRAFFIRDLSGELLWPLTASRKPHGKKKP